MHVLRSAPFRPVPSRTTTRWNRKYACQLAVFDPALLRHAHVSLLVMDKDRGPNAKGEVLGVANLPLAEVLW